jgi:IS5 family transposase
MVIVGFIVINQNLSDERVVLQFKRNPYYQYFCGYSNYMPGMPCNATELVHFRKRIGVKGSSN